MRIKIFKIGYFFLTTFLLLLFQSCSEEESMIDAEREHKVQELLSVSKALAKKHEIGLCFTERMIRGGIDTLTVEDLEQAYEVYAANTVEFYVCTDSVMANENGLKLSRSSQMARETLLQGEGNTILATYRLGWEDISRAKFYYDATLNLRVDWNDQGVVGTAVIFPDDFKIPSSVQFIHTFHNIVFDRDDFAASPYGGHCTGFEAIRDNGLGDVIEYHCMTDVIEGIILDDNKADSDAFWDFFYDNVEELTELILQYE